MTTPQAENARSRHRSWCARLTAPLAAAALGLVALFPAQSRATVIADLIDTPFSTTSAGSGIYDSASINVFIDPANTIWMALSIITTLSSTLPNLSGIPTIQSTQMDDEIRLDVSFGANSTSTILDRNDGFNLYIGNQAIFYGSFPSVGRFNGFTTATFSGVAETGTLDSFFNTHGAGTYQFTANSINVFASTAGHSNIYLLRDVVQVPEPSTLAIFGLGLVGLGFMRRRRRVA